MLAAMWNLSSILSTPTSFPNFYLSLLFSGNIFIQQPSYYNDLDETMPTILQVPALRPALGRVGGWGQAGPFPTWRCCSSFLQESGRTLPASPHQTHPETIAAFCPPHFIPSNLSFPLSNRTEI